MRHLTNTAPKLAAALLALVAATGLVLAACGPTGTNASSGGTSASSAPGAPTTTTGTGGMVPGGGGGGGASTVVPTMPTNPGGAVVPPSAIAGLARIDVPASQLDMSGVKGPMPSNVQTAGGKYVVFSLSESGCQRITAQAGEQSGSRVVVNVVIINTGTAGQMCPMIAREVQEIVALAAPLGGRTLAFQSVIRMAG